jgi:hypothetical protein
VDEIPLPSGVPGRLYATSFSIVGPDPASALEDVDATALVCLITDHEIGLRYPDYGDWLTVAGGVGGVADRGRPRREPGLPDARPERGGPPDSEQSPVRVLRLPIPDYGVTDDDKLLDMAQQVTGLLRGGETVVTHCGAGMGRTGVLCTLVLVQLGAPLAEAALTVRKGRPGSGPDSPEQADQLARLAASTS